MEEKFRPDTKTGLYYFRPGIGTTYKMQDGVWGQKGFIPTGIIFEGTVISVGQNFLSICRSRSKENCFKCPNPPRFCKSPIK